MTTENKTLTTSWQLLQAAPGTVALEVGPLAELHAAASTPAVDAAVQRIRNDGPAWRSFGGTNNIYAKKSNNTAGEVIVSYGE